MEKKRAVAVGALVCLVAIVVSHFFLFYYRDNYSTHLPVKVMTAAAFHEGRIPYWNFSSGGGQPLAGNPNYLTFYPDSILYLLFDPFAAFTLHFLLHLAAAALSMVLLLRTLGLSRERIILGSTLYLLSGVVISTTAFYNLVVAAALIPLSLALLHRLLQQPSSRRAFELGLAWGLLGLAAEPVMIGSVAIASLVLALEKIWPTGLKRWTLVFGTAAVIAAPQIIAFREIAAGTERVMRHFSAQTVLAASLPPWRLLETISGPFFGLITDLSSSGFLRSAPSNTGPTLFLSLFIGPALLVALFQRGTGTVRRYQGLALLTLFLALGRFNPIVVALIEAMPQLRIGRYPEKLALPFTVAAVVLIAQWLEVRNVSRRDRFLLLTTLALAALAVPFAWHAGPLSASRAVAGAAVCAAFLFATLRFDDPRRFRAQAVVLTAPLLLWSLLALPLDLRAPYDRPSTLAGALRNRRVVHIGELVPRLTPIENERLAYRIRAAAAEPFFGAAFGINYALDRSAEGLSSMLTRIEWERFARAREPWLAVRYARLSGASLLISRKPIESKELIPQRILSQLGELPEGKLIIYSILNPRGAVSFPSHLIPTATVGDAVRAIESPSFDDGRDATVSARLADPAAGARSASALSRLGDSLHFSAQCEHACLAVIDQTFFAAWRATVDGRPIPIYVANLDRMALPLPSGRHQVELHFGQRSGWVNATFAISIALMLLELLLLLRGAKPVQPGHSVTGEIERAGHHD